MRLKTQNEDTFVSTFEAPGNDPKTEVVGKNRALNPALNFVFVVNPHGRDQATFPVWLRVTNADGLVLKHVNLIHFTNYEDAEEFAVQAAFASSKTTISAEAVKYDRSLRQMICISIAPTTARGFGSEKCRTENTDSLNPLRMPPRFKIGEKVLIDVAPKITLLGRIIDEPRFDFIRDQAIEPYSEADPDKYKTYYYKVIVNEIELDVEERFLQKLN